MESPFLIPVDEVVGVSFEVQVQSFVRIHFAHGDNDVDVALLAGGTNEILCGEL